MAGVWDVSTTNPVYVGPQQKDQPYGRPFGLCVSDIWFQGGTVEVTVSLPRLDNGSVHPDTSGSILIGYKSVNDEYFAIGLGGYGAAYVVLRFAPEIHSWVGLAIEGSLKHHLHPEQPYRISVHMQGQRLTLKVDGVEVLSHKLESAPPQGRMGLFSWGPSRVEFKETSVIEEPGKVFVIMPLKNYYTEELFPQVIRPTVESGNNLYVHHAGETFGPGLIIKDIEKEKSELKIVIADITESNPNVFYEVGYAHGTKIPTIIMVQKGIDLPFDLSGYRCIMYENTIGGKGEVIERLAKAIKEILTR
jgi:hypothetical protein